MAPEPEFKTRKIDDPRRLSTDTFRGRWDTMVLRVISILCSSYREPKKLNAPLTQRYVVGGLSYFLFYFYLFWWERGQGCKVRDDRHMSLSLSALHWHSLKHNKTLRIMLSGFRDIPASLRVYDFYCVRTAALSCMEAIRRDKVRQGTIVAQARFRWGDTNQTTVFTQSLKRNVSDTTFIS
jgi:hypothetical protein